jgi:hypothetical protein
MKRLDSCAGMTIVELAIAVTVLMVVLGIPGLLISTSSRSYSTSATVSDLASNARRSLDSIAAKLEDSAVGQIVEAAGGPGLSHSQINFRRAVGLTGTTPDWGELERLELQPSPSDPIDGIDNNRNGLVDERVVVWTEDVGLPTEQSQVICRSVRASLADENAGNGLDDNGNGLIDELGLSFSFDGEHAEIWITLERLDSYKVRVQHTARRIVALRN